MNSKKIDKYFIIIFYLLIIFILVIGSWIRIRLYFSDIPMWLDEIMLASNFTDRLYSDIFTPLEAFQKAPPFFFLSVLTLRKIFGVNELVLRFIPFILSIFSLFIYFLFLRENVKSKIGILGGMFMFSFCVPLIYFSAEFKPYVCDVFFSILLLLLYKYLDFGNLNIKKTIIYTFSAIFFVYISFPSIFIIPAIILSKISRNNKFDLKILWILFGILLSGLSLFLYDINNYIFLKGYWDKVEGGFSLFPSIKFIWNFIYTGCKYYIYNFNSIYTPIIVFIILMALVFSYKENRNNARLYIIIFIFALIAASLNAYPLTPKLSLYLLPIFIFLISKFFDIDIYIKSNYQKVVFYMFTSLILVFTIGINIPYFNMDENTLIYYNKLSNGRNKSIEDRVSVKNYCIEILKNYKSEDIIIASEEFVYSLKYYNCRYHYDKILNIVPFSKLPVTKNISNNDMKQIFENNIIDKNKYSKIWFISRNDEKYFKCLNYDDIKSILIKYNLNCNVLKHNDLFLISAYNN